MHFVHVLCRERGMFSCDLGHELILLWNQIHYRARGIFVIEGASERVHVINIKFCSNAMGPKKEFLDANLKVWRKWIFSTKVKGSCEIWTIDFVPNFCFIKIEPTLPFFATF